MSDVASEKFPLYLHRKGQWAKKINQKTHYFGRDKDKALTAYNELLASGVGFHRVASSNGRTEQWYGLERFLDNWRHRREREQTFFENYRDYFVATEFVLERGEVGTMEDAAKWDSWHAEESKTIRACREFVYCIVAGPYVKFGASKNPLRRLNELITGCPELPVLTAIMPGGFSHETDLHYLFREYSTRQECEWFRLEGRLVKFVAELQRLEGVSSDRIAMEDLRDPIAARRRRHLNPPRNAKPPKDYIDG